MPETLALISEHSLRKFPANVRLVALVMLGGALSFAPFAKDLPEAIATGFLVVGASFLSTAFLVVLRGQIAELFLRQAIKVMASFAEQDMFSCVIADSEGCVRHANSRASARFRAFPGVRLDSSLKSVFANPSAVLLRLQALAEIHGKAREDVVTVGSTVPVSVFDVGHGLYCWRFKMDERGQWDDADVPVLTHGRNGALLRVNGAAESLLGFRPETIEQVFATELPPAGEIVRAETADTSIPVTVCELSRSGSVQDTLILPVNVSAGPAPEAPFDDLPVPLMCLSLDGQIKEVNRLAAKLVGDIRPGETNVAQIMQGLGYPIHEWLARSAADDAVPCSEFLRLSRKDKEVFVQVTLSKVVNKGEVCLIAVLNDATELKTLEAQFVQGQKMQAVGQLAGGVAHDFNNLLTAISGHCDLLLLRHDQNDPNYGDLVQINQNANRAAALVSQLLAFSRKQTLQPEVLDLRDTISDLIHLLNRLVGEKIRLILSHDPVL